MSPELMVQVFADGVMLILVMVTVLVMPGLLVGLVVSIFQAATQINEQTLSFLPRLLVTLVTLLVTGPWMLRQLLEYFQQVTLTFQGILV
ncbi:MAG: flagellar biosynthesis protein FliQ [Gammaproteobacteria bacterium]